MPEYDLAKAAAFVGQHGSILEKARLGILLYRQEPPENVYRPLLDLQNRDGGFPSRPRPGSASSVDSTLTALWQLSELAMFNTPAAARALDFLVKMQSYDGSWDENPDLPPYDLPPWIVPGDLATRLYLSAYGAYWLGRGASHPANFDQAIDYLTAQQDASGSLPGYLHTTWIGIAAFLLAGKPTPAGLGLDYLAARPFSEWDDSQIAWALDFLLRAGLSDAHPFVEQARDTLIARQADDGSWGSEDGPSYAASATVSVLKVLALPTDF